ncbi:dolichol-phosphate mannosyltransferase subunit 3 [Myriangium duriaei CBS 260.36]|uniref:Dolichol-phosphate mannosyltransferase subunit 3 n=1 Tax=Myriangium duriaei CBS 260.36 TaxID=1168546 RepID=A0A9P4J2K3_9PEZI|nr:dolichol-phosphate mannosyltransferase subunit 3 [Myriangium duriaei CBS 260.36]
MTKATQSISFIVLLSSIYTALFLGLVPVSSTIQDEIIPVLPLWAVVSFGAYLLFKLGWGVFTFNDVPEAYKELSQQIEQAKVDLRKKGVEVD